MGHPVVLEVEGQWDQFCHECIEMTLSPHATAELRQPGRHRHHYLQPPGEGAQQPQEVQALKQEAQKQPQGQELALYRVFCPKWLLLEKFTELNICMFTFNEVTSFISTVNNQGLRKSL